MFSDGFLQGLAAAVCAAVGVAATVVLANEIRRIHRPLSASARDLDQLAERLEVVDQADGEVSALTEDAETLRAAARILRGKSVRSLVARPRPSPRAFPRARRCELGDLLVARGELTPERARAVREGRKTRGSKPIREPPQHW